MANKASVKIYGREYNIAGEKTEEEIREIADYVDKKMHLISRVAGASAAGNIAVLSAVNIAEEYFDAVNQIEGFKADKIQADNDAKYYQKMWEDVKNSFKEYKEDVSGIKNQQALSDERFKEMQEKCAEYENSFFDLQMENIKLKSELEKIKNGEK